VVWAADDEQERHLDRVTATVFAHDMPGVVLSSSWDGTVKYWDTNTDRLVKTFREHTDGVTGCGYATGGVVFSVSLDRTLRRWRLSEDRSDMRIRLDHRLRGLVVDPSGNMVLCSDMAGTVFLFDVETGAKEAAHQP
jgi:WD40 repeat protein